MRDLPVSAVNPPGIGIVGAVQQSLFDLRDACRARTTQARTFRQSGRRRCWHRPCYVPRATQIRSGFTVSTNITEPEATMISTRPCTATCVIEGKVVQISFYPDTGALRLTDARGIGIHEGRWYGSWAALLAMLRDAPERADALSALELVGRLEQAVASSRPMPQLSTAAAAA
jgi:hypothetical protein